jgi:hypothetical protein
MDTLLSQEKNSSAKSRAFLRYKEVMFSGFLFPLGLETLHMRRLRPGLWRDGETCGSQERKIQQWRNTRKPQTSRG